MNFRSQSFLGFTIAWADGLCRVGNCLENYRYSDTIVQLIFAKSLGGDGPLVNLKFFPSAALKNIFVAAVVLSLTATPSLSGLLCGGSHKANSERTVVAHLDEGGGSEAMSGPAGVGKAEPGRDSGTHIHEDSSSD